ncbi:DTW domain-containing protein [Orrella sp. JC864]|uniref:tRNA-uridine aminocarboxypropyltransferase n=1 Tax=Orrella sp. JC864 TaxID=3120298 RepID=UPI0030099A81
MRCPDETGGRARCARCLRPGAHCLCPLLPSLANRTPVLILQHPQERRHALNTGRLAALGLQQARLECGLRFDPALWLRPGLAPALLFPGPQALPLAAGTLPPPGELLLVVPDATWRHARSLIHHNPALAALPRLALPAGPPGGYRVRKAPGPQALSTVEAVARALDVLDAPARHDALLRPFEALVQGQIQAMGPQVYARNYPGADAGARRGLS